MPSHMTPQGGAITPPVVQRVGRSAVAGIMRAAQPTVPVQPDTAVRLPLGPLADRAQQWRPCGASDWVIKTVTRGYRLQFASTPHRLNGILQSRTQGEKAQILQEEITSLLNKGAIRMVPPERFLFKVFSSPKEGQGSMADIRFACSEQIHETVQVQNVNTHSSDMLCP